MPPETLTTDLLGVLFALLLGSLIGSFANVVIHRLPRSESIAFPGSHCPVCNHRLGPLELVPVLSWLAQAGRCRSCRSPISLRYPLVESVMAVGFALLWLRWPPVTAGWAFLPLAGIYAVLVILAAIDLDTYTLPDVLTMPALALALLASLLYPLQSGLPAPGEALFGAGIGAGCLALVNRLGALVLRRFRDSAERLWPIGFDQVNLAALLGALGGWLTGVVAGTLSLIANLLSRRSLRVPEPALFALWLLVLLLSFAGVTIAPSLAVGGSVAAAGALAVAGGLFWWLRELGGLEATEDEDAEPVAMGFGDVKLAAVMGGLLGWEKLLVALFLSFLLGAIGGVAARLAGGERVVPFGPYLVLATLIALFLGDPLLAWYLGLFAV